MKAADIMTTDFPAVYENESLTKVIGFFMEKKADVVVVKEQLNGFLLGIVTKRSILKPNLNPSTVLAKTLAVKTPKILPSDTLQKVASQMLEKNLKAIPVASARKPVGLVAATDVILNSRDSLGKAEVGTVMTKEVITIGAGDTIGRAISLMRDMGVSRLPVVDGGRLVGIVTVSDIAEKIIKPRIKASWGDVVGERVRTLSNPVRSIMTRNVITTQPSEKIVDAVQRMKEHKLSCLVAAEASRVVGIFTLMDALEPLVARADTEEKKISIEVSYKLDRVDLDVKESVLEVAEKFVQRFRKTLGTGVLSLYFKEHREKHGDLKLIHCRARLNSDRYQFVGIGEAWRPDLAARSALKVIERQFLVRKELAARYPFGREFFESLTGAY
ncbi:MAG: CBS domain-containing protein [Candidatus Caldarchaeum sp.]|nr:CBS domain-containing protein [Candidatus Caldarchaeum sp.]MDW8360015.1 CBS domain-containing protein [Candidatus Caldarchaeum sp.]